MMFKQNSTLAAAVLAAYSAFCLAGCGGELQAEIARIEAKVQESESARQRAVAEIERIEQSARARITRNPLAGVALVLLGDAATKKFADDVSVGEGLIGGGYCLFNSAECTSLAADLQELVASRTRLEAEVKILTDEIARLKASRPR